MANRLFSRKCFNPANVFKYLLILILVSSAFFYYNSTHSTFHSVVVTANSKSYYQSFYGSSASFSKSESTSDKSVRNSTIHKLTYNMTEGLQEDSNTDVEFLLNIRKLNVFAVHEMNRIISGAPEPYRNNCIRWWSNPLETLSYEVVLLSDNHTDVKLNYTVEPGRFVFQIVIRQQNPPINIENVELEIIGLFQSSSALPSESCVDKNTPEAVKAVCVCGEEKIIASLQEETLKREEFWNSTDAELYSWPRDVSFNIGDYLELDNYDSFLMSPARTIYGIPGAQFCAPQLKMLIMVSSAPGHFKHRQTIRETYGSPGNLHAKGMRLVFLMGIPKDETVQKQLKEESGLHDDIIQEKFMDSYHNLTLSHLAMYKWAYLTCTQGQLQGLSLPPFILKADDDFFINVDLALKLVEDNNNEKFEYIGCLFCGTKPIRNWKSKYYTPNYMYIPIKFVGYLSGVVYFMRTEIIPRVLHLSLTTPLIHMDDAYMTGIIPRRLQIVPRGSRLITYSRIKVDSCTLKKTISSHVNSPDDMREQWANFTMPLDSKCSLSDVSTKLVELSTVQDSKCHFH